MSKWRLAHPSPLGQLRLREGGWLVIERRADLMDIPIADFVSLRDAEEWVNWKQGLPKLIPIPANRPVRDFWVRLNSKFDSLSSLANARL
jgi:hypothetical protein